MDKETPDRLRGSRSFCYEQLFLDVAQLGHVLLHLEERGLGDVSLLEKIIGTVLKVG